LCTFLFRAISPSCLPDDEANNSAERARRGEYPGTDSIWHRALIDRLKDQVFRAEYLAQNSSRSLALGPAPAFTRMARRASLALPLFHEPKFTPKYDTKT
jgi:hypothetical protein